MNKHTYIYIYTPGGIAVATTVAGVAPVATAVATAVPNAVGPASGMGLHSDSYLADAHGKSVEETYIRTGASSSSRTPAPVYKCIYIYILKYIYIYICIKKYVCK